MPDFLIHLGHADAVTWSDIPIQFESLDAAYLDAVASIPEIARDLLLAGLNPMSRFFLIADPDGQILLKVPFTERLDDNRSQPRTLPARAATESRRWADLTAGFEAARRTNEILRTDVALGLARHRRATTSLVSEVELTRVRVESVGVPLRRPEQLADL